MKYLVLVAAAWALIAAPGARATSPAEILRAAGVHVINHLTAAAPAPALETADDFHVATSPAARAVTFTAASPLALSFAQAWFCQHALGVRWYMPGPLGEYLPSDLSTRALPALSITIHPAFLSRNLSWPTSDAATAWAECNLLHATLAHGHALLNVIPSALYSAHPDYFPILDGERYHPIAAGDYNWQPALTNPGVIAQSARYASVFFQLHPSDPAVSLCINDSIRFDESAASLAARGRLRWFRNRPDYSDLVFGYMNRVSDQVEAASPPRSASGQGLGSKSLSAYAYYWCENTPSFPVRPNIIPWLTADRTQWYDPRFAREDQALIRRWCAAGPRIVATYDYLYGAPFLIPRLTPHLIADAIKFEHDAGVRAYFAEANPHWAYDAPKLWLAAQLLQDPTQSADTLLSEFYHNFFGPAAAPMRRFYDRCEQAWLGQSGPARWIKFYQDIDQAALFPPSLRTALQADLTEAATVAGAAAPGSLYDARVYLVQSAFHCTDLFCRWSEGQATAAQVQAGFAAAVREKAMSNFDTAVYFRVNAPPAPGIQTQANAVPAAAWHDAPLQDPNWQTLHTLWRLNDTTFTWSKAPWLARGEPVYRRSIRVYAAANSVGKAVRFQRAAGERISQWTAATPGALYRAEVTFRGQVTPGNETYLIVSFRTKTGAFTGPVAQSQVRPGIYSSPTPLRLLTQAPPDAAELGIAIYVYHQEPGDWSELSHLTLRQAAPASDGQVSSEKRRF